MNEDSSDDEEAENQKSVVIDNESHSDSSKEGKASSVSITIGILDAGSLDRDSSGSSSQEEDAVSGESLKSEKNLDECGLESLVENGDHYDVVAKVRNSFILNPVHEESMPLGENLQNVDKPLNFDKYHSAAELEIFGLEHLKAEPLPDIRACYEFSSRQGFIQASGGPLPLLSCSALTEQTCKSYVPACPPSQSVTPTCFSLGCCP